MKKRLVTLVIALGLAMALTIPVGAADLHDPHKGTTCADGIATLHFVNNQTDSTTGYLVIILDSGTVGPLVADVTLKKVQHWFVAISAGDVLLDAYTTNSDGGDRVTDSQAGKLVLSDWTCDPPKKT